MKNTLKDLLIFTLLLLAYIYIINNIEYIKAGDMNFNVAGKKYDLVVIYTKLVNHSTTEKLDSQLHNSDIPIIRFNEAGLTSFIHCLFNYIYGGDEKAYGMYKA